MTEAEKKSWKKLAREKYTKPLIFHDGRLAMRPTLTETLAILTWLPFGFILALIRSITGLSLPYIISYPLLAISGLNLTISQPNNNQAQAHIYVCNHRTLMDPLYISFTLKRDLVAVTYSLSRFSEIVAILAPIKTVRLTRNRNEDEKMMKRVLEQGDNLVVCPEGTTCREPYLLRFSPLFSEICCDHKIVPVAIDSHVSMFHGTTAGGIKCLDPLFFLMNPFPLYSIQFLEEVSPLSIGFDNKEDSRFEVANFIQTRIGKALGFECTKLTRKDKYLVLAGNEGIVSTGGKY